MRIKHPLFFFSRQEKKRIVSAIREAEENTSGEIRVHLERKVKGDILEYAAKVFNRIGMTKTRDRNGVLILLSLKDKRFAILGDKGINEKVPGNFWDDAAAVMAGNFKEDRFAEGVEGAILRVGAKLKEYFPYKTDDRNELPNSISQ